MGAKGKEELLKDIRRILDVVHETRLVATILSYGRVGCASTGMVEGTLDMVKHHLDYARAANDAGLAESCEKLKAGLEEALAAGIETMRSKLGPTDETVKVEIPLATAREAMGHRIRRQMRCAGGVIDFFDLTADEIIECKLIGTGASLGQAAGQLRRYSKSFPGTALSIAVRYIEPDAEWLAGILRGQGLTIIELDQA
ncbi:hypothetical protein [Bradyrhizobium japonicum]|uniref:hypothetical protein n=1 Tax=Bradyrhizobium japonicum TaxID=375 RepID=UPI001E343478|nr:hypothetical protein [Bradyrhizobium japonicum]MCD9825252.1 hypothetical protein [Bradyrhizobium japonicum]MCD9898271.1 hypothetical protein [Bradyrhizobium japonicum]MEB2671238.1 hypothetical protein [Bradyrhizobium japonicum]WLB28532.1 hypothetical protein QIH85_43175 [Bradyrhizobium japonicum]WRI90553.1 hypothetical protein R3F75_06395 [Bradyrhizobium japonicum]